MEVGRWEFFLLPALRQRPEVFLVGRLVRFRRFVGEELGKGKTLAEITAHLNEVAEGINTARAVKKLADRAGLEMPITNEVNAVLYDGKPARDAVAELMSRPLREEK